jgi:hypothetical protein
MLLGNKDYAEVPLPLIWVMALAASDDPSRCLDAFTLWEKHSSSLNTKVKGPFTKMLIRKLSAVRLDLALKILIADNSLSFPDNSILLSELQTAYDKNVLFQSAQNLTLFIEAAGKIPPQKGSKAILWTIEKCIMQKEYAKAMEFAEASQLYPQFLELLKQGNPDGWNHIIRNAAPSRLPDAISRLCAWKPAPALEWKHLFDKIKNEGNKDLCIKAWNDFRLSLDNPQMLQGTQDEIAEAWHAALKAIDRHHRRSSLELMSLWARRTHFYPSLHIILSKKPPACCYMKSSYMPALKTLLMLNSNNLPSCAMPLKALLKRETGKQLISN